MQDFGDLHKQLLLDKRKSGKFATCSIGFLPINCFIIILIILMIYPTRLSIDFVLLISVVVDKFGNICL